MIKKTDHIVTAWAERASGPGWGNMPLWVLVRDKEGKLREDVIQPHEQTPEMVWMYDASQATHYAMREAVVKWQTGRRK